MTDPLAPEVFEQARQRFMQGLAGLQAQRPEDAEGHFIAALQLVPGRVSTLVNLAATRLALGKFDAALKAADAVLAIEPDNRDGWFHRATALGGLLRLEEAASGFERALAIDGAPSEIWLRYAQTLHALNRHGAALASYRRALAIDPAQAGAWSRCGDILRSEGRLPEAAQAFEQALEHGGDAELNRYFLAACTPAGAPTSVPTSTPPSYVRALFDGYADDFDQHLVGVLGYQAHTVLLEHLQAFAPAPFASAIDLGCGTGLCGPLVRPLMRPQAGRLVGVDLSAPMLEKARALKVYDQLLQADVVEHLNGTADRHDLVLAADVLIYLGELAPLFAAVRRATMDSALFCFSVELPSRDGLDVELMPSLRYAHSEAYLRRLAAEHGLKVLGSWRKPLRQDQRVPIDGLYMVLQRSG